MMKRLCYLLCLLNVGYFFWQFHSGRINPIEPAEPKASAILLVSENLRANRGALISSVLDQSIHVERQTELEGMLADLKPQHDFSKLFALSTQTRQVKTQTEPVKAREVVPTEPESAKQCYQIGSFASEVQLRQWLNKHGLSHRKLWQEGGVPAKDFQVYYPAAKTPEQSLIDKMLLTAKGQQGIWKIASGDLQGSYSLGVFSDRQRATVFKNQLAEQGIRAEIFARGEMQPKWLAAVMLTNQQSQRLKSLPVDLSACLSQD
jgi:hypothetical protein